MKDRIIFVFLTALMLGAGTGQAQNRYFQDGEHGISLQGGGLWSDGASGLAGVATLTIMGRFDLGVGYTSPQSTSGVGYTYHWNEFTPFLGVSLLRPQVDRPLGVDFTASYTTVKFSGVQASRLGGDSKSAGVDLYFALRESNSVTILPRVGAAYVSANAWYKPEVDLPETSETVESIMFGLELAFLIKNKFIIAPSVTSFDGIRTLSFMVGLALPQEW